MVLTQFIFNFFFKMNSKIVIIIHKNVTNIDAIIIITYIALSRDFSIENLKYKCRECLFKYVYMAINAVCKYTYNTNTLINRKERILSMLVSIFGKFMYRTYHKSNKNKRRLIMRKYNSYNLSSQDRINVKQKQYNDEIARKTWEYQKNTVSI